LDSAVNNITTLSGTNGSKLAISSGASLTLTGGGNAFQFGHAGTGNILTMTGGSLSLSNGGGQIGSATANSATVNFSGGTWTSHATTNLIVNAGATVNISGSASMSAQLVVNGVVNQSGGTVTIPTSNLSISGTYRLSGGSLQVPGGTRDLSLGTSAVFKIVGSASAFSLGRHVAGTGTLVFELDNSAKHITTIQSSTYNLNRSGTLAVNLAGGILLSNKNHFDLIEAESLSATDFATKPGGAGSLWTTGTGTNINGTRDSVRITLNSALLQGTLDDADAPTLTLGSNVSKGYINLDDFGDAIVLNISLGGGVDEASSLMSFQTALTNANVTWSNSTLDGFDIALTLDGETAGKEYFAWDFTSIEGMGTGYGINAISSIPEPGTVAGLILGGSVLMLGLRKRYNSKS
jgi:hypothetical protein